MAKLDGGGRRRIAAKGGPERHRLVLVSLAVLGVLPLVSDSSSAAGTTEPASEGRIVFGREESDLYTVNPDGSDLQLLMENAMMGTWSPDGTEISVFCCGDGMAAHIVDVESGDMRVLEPQDPTLETHCGAAWSPDGERLVCGAYGVDDPGLNGLHSIRASDGGDLRRITSNPGGEDRAGDYSPDGTQVVFVRWREERPVGLFVTNVDGSGLEQLTPADMIMDDSHSGSWSPDGEEILFVARESEDHRNAIWIVNVDSGELEQFPITPECGGLFSESGVIGCSWPSWSPDGDRIVFTRSDGTTENIYIVNADGSALVQVTDGGADDQPNWGPTT